MLGEIHWFLISFLLVILVDDAIVFDPAIQELTGVANLSRLILLNLYAVCFLLVSEVAGILTGDGRMARVISRLLTAASCLVFSIGFLNSPAARIPSKHIFSDYGHTPALTVMRVGFLLPALIAFARICIGALLARKAIGRSEVSQVFYALFIAGASGVFTVGSVALRSVSNTTEGDGFAFARDIGLSAIAISLAYAALAYNWLKLRKRLIRFSSLRKQIEAWRGIEDRSGILDPNIVTGTSLAALWNAAADSRATYRLMIEIAESQKRGIAY
ncbi:hypothetical protein ACIBCN_19115 [Nocardia sp. NPDC051052]|uniref:hypothetical protein n=1 Tax=Nocardia sp. NPDC051052 TaxID=3364322 RepID=UPI0037BC461D